MRKLIILLDKMPLPPDGSPIEDWYNSRVRRKAFVRYLIYKTRFGEDIRDTLHKLISDWNEPESLPRARKRRQYINDILDKCIDRKYISLESGVHGETMIKDVHEDTIRAE